MGVVPWRYWTLKSRLALVVGVLSGVALIVANVVGVLLIQRYLEDRIDEQLIGISRPLAEFAPNPNGFVPRGGRGRGIGPDQVMYFIGADGALDTTRSDTAGAVRPPVPSLEEIAARAVTRTPYTVATVDGADWRMIAVERGDSGAYAVVGTSLDEVEQTTQQLILIDSGVLLLVLTALAFGAAFVVRIGLRPLTEMEAVAADISGGNLSGRVPGTDPHTEPGRLGLALNAMLTRIEGEVDARTASEQRLRQFVADASHELRTPLTSIRGWAELYRRGGSPPGPQLDETMGRIEAESARMAVLVEDLLRLARMDQHRTLDLRRIDLLEIAADTIRDAHARAPGRQVLLAGLSDAEDTFEPATVLGDDHGLRQVVTNLVANALSHTPPGTTVTVRVGLDGDEAVLAVCDDGPGVPPEHADRVFERLYRADSSRSRAHGGGSGLGLAIVAAIVQQHGGRVELRETPGGGATFRVALPAVGDSA
ncbi:two-component sensor histidine kinase [Actinoplanes philippinensis]|uniref:histidine kinase n=1 Tax=Actinoplanes philippinensis TaxID=35752 RepID=A0A1I2CT48_9ACTN|nr:HAMP domain-containing sensor histidine kinase [Actinoplanes philippinensis]GIE74696.1 two-component sensor histidine kinase [Actinoplanes philippinensis]SFE71517.1 two-component system, OmpR family, sensor kinase [Actinoplanes philippinensis]